MFDAHAAKQSGDLLFKGEWFYLGLGAFRLNCHRQGQGSQAQASDHPLTGFKPSHSSLPCAAFQAVNHCLRRGLPHLESVHNMPCERSQSSCGRAPLRG
ncbi:hypothetical protein Y88_0036 [Novosphingobium nitrogenifigens DSM 19370]|uniref:Uncharacterized protein n=1 Tax=Novosphingobium nitrogenifigens DSM 19370 TaxID=983920 RepID=F1Z4S6_9SPHN|nr:hypothetical protein Y88_0036 [Novosphingobium nitrogenifigens DSM 19370]